VTSKANKFFSSDDTEPITFHIHSAGQSLPPCQHTVNSQQDIYVYPTRRFGLGLSVQRASALEAVVNLDLFLQQSLWFGLRSQQLCALVRLR